MDHNYSTPPSSPPSSPNKRAPPPRAPSRVRPDKFTAQQPFGEFLSQTEIVDNLKRFYKTDDDKCIICLEDLNEDGLGGVCMLGRCGHMFHCECIHTWDTAVDVYGERTNTCPKCREYIQDDSDIISGIVLPMQPFSSNSFGKKNELKYLLSFIK